MIVASLMQAFSLTYATRVVLSKTNLYFDLWHGKHSVTQSRAVLFFLKLLIIIIIIIIIILFFFWLLYYVCLIFTILVFCQSFGWFREGSVGFRVVPARFWVIPGRFRGVPGCSW